MALLKVYIVDDHQMLIDGLKALLHDEEGISVVGENNSPKQAVNEIETYKPDVLLTDINMPELDGVELTKIIRKKLPNTKIIALSMFGERETIQQMLKAGANGYILKNTGKQELIKAIKQVSENNNFFSKEVEETLNQQINLQTNTEARLSLREIEIIELIAKEFSNAQIAETLFISERTVETHRKNIFRKTNTKSVLGLIKYCIDKKIIRSIT
jgi:two-component system, NarL family, nitrate/nitrite response regulator NarL